MIKFRAGRLMLLAFMLLTAWLNIFPSVVGCFTIREAYTLWRHTMKILWKEMVTGKCVIEEDVE